jgi:hypothetical protein
MIAVAWAVRVDRLPAASKASTAYLYVLPAAAVVSV